MKLLRNYLVAIGLLSSLDAWSETATVKVGGDIRIRHEKADKQGSESRSRQRIRARLHAKSQINEHLKAGIGIATGDAATSRNQTFTGGFSPKGFNLDLAYFDYERSGFNLTGGKIKNPFFRAGGSQLVWDGDVTLEGANIKYSGTAGSFGYFAQAGEFWYDERRSDTNDGILYTGQLGASYKMEIFEIKLGAAVYNYNYIEGRDVIGGAAGNNTVDVTEDTEGNVTSTTYANKYIIQDYGLELSLPKWGVSVFANSIENGEVDEDGSGYLVGASVKIGNAKIKVVSASLEKDATIGALSDGDFGGGGTDRKGENVQVSYKLDDNTSIALSQRFEKLAVEDGQDYQLTRFDLNIKF